MDREMEAELNDGSDDSYRMINVEEDEEDTYDPNAYVDSSDEQIDYEEDLEKGLEACLSAQSQLSVISKLGSDSSESTEDEEDDEDKARIQLKDPNTFAEGFKKTSGKAPQDKRDLFFESKLHRCLVGMTYINDDLMVLNDLNILLRKDHEELEDNVKILTGGKAGLDPLYSGYVAKGMITGAVIGSIKDVPNTTAILQAIRELAHNHKKGILIIIPNSLEERMNFGLAMERARADGILIDMITVGDDATEKVSCKVGRRGLAGIILIYKIAGSMAEARKPMVDIFTMCRSLASMSLVSISARTGKRLYIGTGIDGCKGQFFKSNDIKRLVKKMVHYLINPSAYFSLQLTDGADVVVLLNVYNLDMPLLHYIACDAIPLIAQKFNIKRIYPGHFINGPPGFSISVMHCCSDEVLYWLDQLPQSSVWPRPKATGNVCIKQRLQNVRQRPELLGPSFVDEDSVISAVKVVCREIRENEDYLNEMDPFGEFGSQICGATKAIESGIREKSFQSSRPFNMLSDMSIILEEQLQGATGSYLSLLFEAGAQAFLIYPSFDTINGDMWLRAIKQGIAELRIFANLKSGVCGFVDSLDAAYSSMTNVPSTDVQGILFKGTEAANEFCKSTETKKSQSIKPGYPDVTAYCALILLRSLYSVFYKQD